MSVSSPNKTVNVQSIPCTGSAEVTLSFLASSELISRPSDIVLLFDVSSSMRGEKIDIARKAAKDLVNLVAKASGGKENEYLANKSRMALISFANQAVIESQLTENIKNIVNKIDSLTPIGNTNHSDAFEKAQAVIDLNTDNDIIVIMFTDGLTTVGPPASTVAIKNAGAEVFCIGLIDDPKNLMEWASNPLETHVVYSNDSAKIEEMFSKIAYETIKAGAYDVVIREELNKDFKIVDYEAPANGKVKILNPQTLEWTMAAVGVGKDEKTALTFKIMHIGTDAGIKEINKSISYSDRAGDIMQFPNPTINIKCGGSIINPEPCPKSFDVVVNGCKDSVREEVPAISLQSLGRVVQLDVPIKNICPNRRAAAAVVLTELDSQGVEHIRGMKTFLIPAMSVNSCRDIMLRCVSFVLPEELDTSGNTDSICNERKFKVRAFANYIDTDFNCCEPNTVIIKD